MRRKRKQDGGGSEPSPCLNLVPCEWNPIFATRRQDIKEANENEQFIETREVEDSVVRCFMKSPDESDACLCLPRADKVEGVCFGASLEDLQAEKGEPSKRSVAWLDERSSAAGKEHARAYRGPLTAPRLYQELKRPVSCPNSDHVKSRGLCELYTSASAVVDQAQALLPLSVFVAGVGARLRQLPSMATV
jgi:hypothetical protein